MPRPKGLPKSGGRKRGTPNKRSTVVHEIFDHYQFNPATRIMEMLEKLNPLDQVQTCVKLMPYMFPRRKDTLLPFTESTFGHSDLSNLTEEQKVEVAVKALESYGWKVVKKGNLPEM